MSDFPNLPFLPTFRSRLTAVAIGLALVMAVVGLIVMALVGDGYGSAQAVERPIKIGLSMSLTGHGPRTAKSGSRTFGEVARRPGPSAV